jgi:excisionase family DNA binding protein
MMTVVQEKLLLTVPEAAARLGVARTFLYARVMRGELASIKLGRARRITIMALEQFVARLVAEQQGTTPLR